MKIHFLGTCAGTEPMPTRKHSSTAVELNGALYFLDAGEGCSYTAHNMGLDLLTTKEIFISHTHLDHVGGLCNLLWTVRKLRYHYGKKTKFDTINVYIPTAESFEGVMKILRNSEDDFKCDFAVVENTVVDGEIFDDGQLKVTAAHNTHLRSKNFAPWQSFSYKLEAEGKSIVYSGDVASYSELDGLIGEHCDALIIETGHFVINDVYEYTKDKNVDRIFFTHNGREIIFGTEECRERVGRLFGGLATICEDGMTVEL
ncbi:MAG: ribonuclease Z [Clostridia bacterium]|nr:ribonuclease Z [Clostridia bacterium]